MEFQVTYADGTERVVNIVAADLVRYEDEFGKPGQGVGQPGSETTMREYLFLIWNAERRTQNTALPYDEWLDLGVDLDRDADPKEQGNRATRRATPAPRKRSSQR